MMTSSVMLLSRSNQKYDHHHYEHRHRSQSQSYQGNNVAGKVQDDVNNNPEVQEYIIDRGTKTTYLKGKFLGKGGFARCYEMTDLTTNVVYAGKIIPKSRLAKPHQKEKIAREVDLHSKLDHSNVVKFHHYFEDDNNVYIVLENCTRKSLVHVLKHRRTLTEPEVRYYMVHLVYGCRYVHSQKVIHRDLKLGNMLLNEEMQVKIGDLGLATRVEATTNRKITICGTPNYIAPEVLNKEGHGYEADFWAIGCIMYALLVGRPPFETATLKDTYARISANRYTLPSYLSSSARSLIIQLLNPDPSLRPTLDATLQHPFFSSGLLPKSLPGSCCTHQPKFPSPPPSVKSSSGKESKDTLSVPCRRPRSSSVITRVSGKSSQQKEKGSSSGRCLQSVRDLSPVITNVLRQTVSNVMRHDNRDASASPLPSNNNHSTTTHTKEAQQQQQQQQQQEQQQHRRTGSTCSSSTVSSSSSSSCSAGDIHEMLHTCLINMPSKPNPALPSLGPCTSVLWITKWVDYSNKYGFGFQLSDKSVGVLFNDGVQISMAPNRSQVYFKDIGHKPKLYTTSNTPTSLQKRTVLLQYFSSYMDENLIQVCGALVWYPRAYCDPPSFQINFFSDHTKVIVSSEQDGHYVSFIDEQRRAYTYRAVQLAHFGCCSPVLLSRLQYVRDVAKGLGEEEGASL
ncbi:PREDICTED: serine/threonine-protein kinase PLK2-like [Priapulus caudatus]|uniref:Serine/threonine-protein kinase PLK n=1 Tax=Priapulus caudatus TaxID=37621 RepID=A0ABM1EZV5_PRICU|nr:PREDICTED: serine/threonine-protein kinase PLK2-like [Priapulus caudatus]